MRNFYLTIGIYLILFFMLYYFANYFMSTDWEHENGIFISLGLIMLGLTVTAVLWSNVFQNMYQIENYHGIIYTITAIAWIFVFPAVSIYRSIHDANEKEAAFNSKFTTNIDSVFNTLKLEKYQLSYKSGNFNFEKSRVLIGNYSDSLCSYNYEMTKMLDTNLIAYNIDDVDYFVIISGEEVLADGMKYEDGTYAYRYNTTISFYDPRTNLIMDEFKLTGQNPPSFIHRTDSRCGERVSNDSIVNFIEEKITQ